MPRGMMGISRASLADILRAVLFGAGRNRESKHGTAIQIARIGVTTRIGGSRILYWKEIDKVIKRRDVFEALNSSLVAWATGQTGLRRPDRT